MEIDLSRVSLTLAAGLILVIAWYMAVSVTWPEVATSFYRRVFTRDQSPRWAAGLAGAVIIFCIGILAEEMSRNALSERTPAALGQQLLAVLPSEKWQRASSLVSSPGFEATRMLTRALRSDGSIGPLHALSGCASPRYEQRWTLVTVNPIGREVFGALCAARTAGRASIAENAYYDELIAAAHTRGWRTATPAAQRICTTDACDGMCGALRDRATRLVLPCKDVVETLPNLYYAAKHAAYLLENPYDELEKFRNREDLARTAFFGIFSAIYLLAALYCTRAAWEMGRDVGRVKPLFSAMLRIVVLVFFLDAIGPAPSVFANSMPLTDFLIVGAFEIEKPERWLLVAEFLRLYSLPAAFLWVWMYNMRRMVRRKGADAVAPIGRREQMARRTIRLMLLLFVVLIPIGGAFQSSQRNYVNRVFAYYADLRGKTSGAPTAASDTAMAVVGGGK